MTMSLTFFGLMSLLLFTVVTVYIFNENPDREDIGLCIFTYFMLWIVPSILVFYYSVLE